MAVQNITRDCLLSVAAGHSFLVECGASLVAEQRDFQCVCSAVQRVCASQSDRLVTHVTPHREWWLGLMCVCQLC